jgi:flavin reductase (DIM6/NTAB) family NADH-FMN oxidoreductase RutF
MNFTVTSEEKQILLALFNVTHGLYIVTAVRRGRYNGQCLDALMQPTSHPPRIAISMRKSTFTHEMVSETGIFTVNVLCRDDVACSEKIKLFGLQSGRQVNKFKDIVFTAGRNGAPIIDEALAFFECRVDESKKMDLGTHTLFIAEVTRAGYKTAGDPLTYCEYRKTLKDK